MYTTVYYLVEMVNGHLVAQSPNPAVPYSLLAEIWKWMNEKASLEDVVVRLRPRTVPNGYKYHTWKEGTIANLENHWCIIIEYASLQENQRLSLI